MNEKEMCIEIAFRDFKLKNKSIINAFKRIQFPDSGIRFLFTEGYNAKEEEIENRKTIEKQISELLKKQFT
ncbi:MAG: hypothetical protein ACK5SP_01925 [bacterium]|jgi:hypothetical protein